MNFRARTILVLGLLLTATIGLHAAWHGEKIPLVKPLADFPKQLAGLPSQDLPIPAWQWGALHEDDHLSREYMVPGGVPLFLSIGYYKSQRTGATVHTPTNCLPGNGWSVTFPGRMRMRLGDGREVPVNYYVVQKGLDKQVVVYWYQAHGRVVASEYWGRLYTMVDAVRLNRTDASLVRITTPIVTDEADARNRVLSFAKLTVPEVQKLIPN